MEEIKKPKMTKEELKKEIKRREERDRKRVKGVFRFNEVPGGKLSFSYSAYGEPVARYDLTDGQIYELPLGVARHLNTNCWYPQHAFKMNEQNEPIMQMSKKIRRTSFQSLEFMDIEDHQIDADLIIARPL